MAFTFKNEVVLEASLEHIWQAINDPNILRASIPGCETLERTEDGAYAAVVGLKIGPISARFQSAVRFTNVDAPHTFRLVGEGQGGVAGFAKGTALVRLSPEGGNTRLAYEVDADIGGKIAQLGSRLIDSMAKKLSDKFFTNFAKAVEAGGAADSK
jgi:carbon monoxide dehydrogenase subunit G